MQLVVTSAVEVGASRVKKNIGRGAQLRSKVNVDARLTGRIRTGQIAPIEIRSDFRAAISSKCYLRPRPMKLVSSVECKSFVATLPPAPPEGSVYRTTIAGLKSANPPRLNGSRLIKGDLTPLSIRVVGQRMQGLRPTLIAKQRNDLTAPAIVKDGMHQTDEVLDAATQTEQLMAQFAIEPQDTINLPDKEVEFQYQLKFSDGIGRTHTVEMGFFTVYPPFPSA
jgi:hypothetical protein